MITSNDDPIKYNNNGTKIEVKWCAKIMPFYEFFKTNITSQI